MTYLYGTFSNSQVQSYATIMHNDIHKLLLYKDKNINEVIFNTEDDFLNYFTNLLFRFGGYNELLGRPVKMIALMSTLQAAYDEVQNEDYDYNVFRKLILDSHGYIKSMFEEVVEHA